MRRCTGNWWCLPVQVGRCSSLFAFRSVTLCNNIVAIILSIAAGQWSVELAGRNGRPGGECRHNPRQVAAGLPHNRLLRIVGYDTFVVREFMEEALDSIETGSKKVSLHTSIPDICHF